MNIYLAKSLLEKLNSRYACPPLTTKLGKKTKYYVELTDILIKTNIPFTDDNILEIKWRIKNLDFSEKSCKGCGNPTKFVNYTKGFRNYCTGSCGAIHRDPNSRKGWVTDKGRQLMKKTLIQKYGVTHQAHIPEVHEKNQNKIYKTYSIFSPSGEEYRVQGYERFVIPSLWNQYREDDVVVKKRYLPKIEYHFNGKIRKYYPDCFIVSENKICEIKSIYTIKSPLLIAKMQAVVEKGYIPQVYLYHKGETKVFSLDDVKLHLSKK